MYDLPTTAQFPQHLKDNMLHVVVWDQITGSCRYKLQAYVNKKFMVEFLKKDRQFEWAFFPEWHGSHGGERIWENKHGYISVLEYSGMKSSEAPTAAGEVTYGFSN